MFKRLLLLFLTALMVPNVFLPLLFTSSGTVKADSRHNSPSIDDISLLGIDGKHHPLRETFGKVTIVNFFASWCYPCRYEMPLLDALYKNLKDKGLSIIAIGVSDEFANIRSFAQRNNFSFPIFFDANGLAKKAFGVESIPRTYVINDKGDTILALDPTTGKLVRYIDNPLAWQSPKLRVFLEKLLSS